MRAQINLRSMESGTHKSWGRLDPAHFVRGFLMRGTTMKYRLLMMTAAAAFSATMAFGQITTDSIVIDFQEQGYTHIEIKVGLTQIKVEAIRGATKVEIM